MSQHLIREIQNLKQELSLLKEALGMGPGYGTDPGQVDIGKVVDNHEKRIKALEAANPTPKWEIEAKGPRVQRKQIG